MTRKKSTSASRNVAVPRLLGERRIYIEIDDGSLLRLGIEPGHALVFEPRPLMKGVVYLESRHDPDEFAIGYAAREGASLVIVGETGPFDMAQWAVKGFAIAHVTSFDPLVSTINETGLEFKEQVGT